MPCAAPVSAILLVESIEIVDFYNHFDSGGEPSWETNNPHRLSSCTSNTYTTAFGDFSVSGRYS